MSNSYIIRFVLILCFVAALALSGMYSLLKDTHDRNEALFNKRAILKAVENYLDKPVDAMTDPEVQNLFDTKMAQKVIDMSGKVIEGVSAESVDMGKERKKPADQRRLPLYVYNSNDDGKLYIVSVRGNGLWDEIWGNLALKSDFNTIAGATFDHKAETPGLGAEIKDNPAFPRQFIGKELFDQAGDFVSVEVVKVGGSGSEHKVDGISGATITGNGVSEMLDRGISWYLPYFETLKQTDAGMGMVQ